MIVAIVMYIIVCLYSDRFSSLLRWRHTFVALAMNLYTFENKHWRYAEFKEALEVKGDGKCYFPCNDYMGLWTRRILRTNAEKHCKEKGHAKGGFEYRPLVIRYSLDSVLIVIVLVMYSQNVLSFKIYVLYIIH